MNLNEKEKLKAKVDELHMLLSCVDESFTFEHSTGEYKFMSVSLLNHLLAICHGNRMEALNLLLRMTKETVLQMKVELGG